MTEQERPSEAAMRGAMAAGLEGEAVPTVTVIHGRTFIPVVEYELPDRSEVES